jgi:type II secretory pathway pseudopilin PulG
MSKPGPFRVFNDEEGLTVVEVTIVLLIGAVLAGVIVVNLNGVVTNAKLNSFRGTLSGLQAAVDAYAFNTDGRLPTATGRDGELLGDALDNEGKAFAAGYTHGIPPTACAEWGLVCGAGRPAWRVNANGKVYFTDGATARMYWYLPGAAHAAGTGETP